MICIINWSPCINISWWLARHSKPVHNGKVSKINYNKSHIPNCIPTALYGITNFEFKTPLTTNKIITLWIIPASLTTLPLYCKVSTLAWPSHVKIIVIHVFYIHWLHLLWYRLVIQYIAYLRVWHAVSFLHKFFLKELLEQVGFWGRGGRGVQCGLWLNHGHPCKMWAISVILSTGWIFHYVVNTLMVEQDSAIRVAILFCDICICCSGISAS